MRCEVNAAVGVDAAQVAQIEAGDDAGQERGDQRAFADALDGAEGQHGDDGGDCDEADVVADLDFAEVDACFAREDVNGTLAGEHEDIGDAEKIAAHTKAYEDRFLSPFVAAERGYIDQVIYPHSTRETIIRVMRLLRTKRETLPPKKHGNIPL